MYLKRWNLVAVVAFSVGVAVLSMSSAFPQTPLSDVNPPVPENPALRSSEGMNAYDPPPTFHVRMCLTDTDPQCIHGTGGGEA